MKNFLFLFVFSIVIFFSCTSEETTTYYLIRHAEKDRTDKTNRNPNLNEDGLKRAKKWVEYFNNIHLDAVYSTNYNRTLQTAKPTADHKNLEIKNYNPRNLFDLIFQQETKGKTVLVVGHSNTTPAFVNAILNKKDYPDMDDNDNASLYIVTLKGDEVKTVVLKID